MLPGCAPGHDELAVLVELHHARFLVSVGYEECAIGQPADVRLASEGLAVRTNLLGERWLQRVAGLGRISRGGSVHRADGLQQLLAIVAEDADHLVAVIDGPHAFFRIIRIDENLVHAAL